MMRQRGLTYISLLVAMALLAFLIALFAQSSVRAREAANRMRCARQLKALGSAIQLYANENKGEFPRTTFIPDATISTYTASAALDPFGPGGPKANDVTANIFLLLRSQDISSEIFICPSTDLKGWNFNGKGGQEFSNFPDNRNLSYSFANPYPGSQAAQAGYRLELNTRADFALAADMNPGGTILSTLAANSPPALLRSGNSKNHGGAGQNVLYADCHVAFQTTSFCGAKQDCIFTIAGKDSAGFPLTTSTSIVGSPTWDGDSVLLPVADIDPGYVSEKSIFVKVLTGIFALGALLVSVLWSAFRKHPMSRAG